MVNRFFSKRMIATGVLVFLLMGCQQGPAPTREALVEKFPDIEAGSLRAENKEILCPFVRMMERAGLFDEETNQESPLNVAVSSVRNGAEDFGCATVECGAVASAVANAQGGGGIDLELLHEANGIAHECGLTFAFGGTEVDDEVRAETLSRLAELADEDGNLIYDDLLAVKLEICAEQDVTMTTPGETEVKLIFAYLGGVENGSVPLSDVDRFLHATMPEYKTTSWVNATLLGNVQVQE